MDESVLNSPEMTARLIGNRPNTYTFTKVSNFLLRARLLLVAGVERSFCKPKRAKGMSFISYWLLEFERVSVNQLAVRVWKSFCQPIGAQEESHLVSYWLLELGVVSVNQ